MTTMPEPIRCAARCSQHPNCQHDWRDFEAAVAEKQAARSDATSPVLTDRQPLPPAPTSAEGTDA